MGGTRSEVRYFNFAPLGHGRRKAAEVYERGTRSVREGQ